MTKTLRIWFMLACHLAPVFVFAQAERPRLAFEVASIAPADPSKPYRPAASRSDPGRIALQYIHLKFLTMRAYNILNYQFHGQAWMETKYFDVNATLPEGAGTADVPAMLQTLLAERFGLKEHRETRVESGYALIVDKNGPKLKKSDPAAPFMVRDLNGGKTTGSFLSAGHLELGKISMKQFAVSLSAFIDQPVIDMTDLPGDFDIVLDVDSATLPGLASLLHAAPSDSDLAKGSIFTELQRLGLKLDARKVPVKHLVIDHIEKVPTAN
jgi:uncharacterized protein (TIGR03435 family)